MEPDSSLRVHKRTPLRHILSQFTPVSIVALCFTDL